jgi:DNA polymerase III epsilon subunit-like protein
VSDAKTEVFISIDVETAGPIPGEYSMLTLGACLAYPPGTAFSCEIKPTSNKFVPAALEVSGLSLERLQETGLTPQDAMSQFAAWIGEVCGPDGQPVFVGLNAPFDWAFVNYYFHKFTGANPFGFTALDIKALYMGKTGCSWGDTRSSRIAERVSPTTESDHDALHDAVFQAELFRLVMALA